MEMPDTSPQAFGFYQNRLKVQGDQVHAGRLAPRARPRFWTEPLLTPGPGGEENWRDALFPPEKVFEALEEVYSKGIQVFCHANGDAARST